VSAPPTAATESLAARLARWTRPELHALEPYSLVAPLDDAPAVRHALDQNEVPWDVPAPLKRLALERLAARDWSRYPEMHSERLRELLAQRHGVAPQNVLCGNGSGELLRLVLAVFGGPGREVLGHDPSFALYRPLVLESGARPRFLPPRPDLRLPLQELEREIDAEPTRPLLLCSPNNPTGDAATPAKVERLLERLDAPLLLDNAYAEFCRHDYRPLLPRHPHLVLLRTLSKAWSLAGLRIGYLLAHEEIVAELTKVKLPYNVSHAGAVLGEVALEHPRHAERCVSLLRNRRGQWAAALRGRGLEVFDSEANFLLVRTPDAAALRTALAAEGILVRDVSRYPGLAGCVRVAIGTTPALRAILHVLDRLHEPNELPGERLADATARKDGR
jgi:histidinol-phosphate aminotransferase